MQKKNTAFIPYTEAGFSLLVFNFGAGYGPVIDESFYQQANLFAGLAAPVIHYSRARIFFIQLYYRPIFNFTKNDLWMSNEVGLLLKWLFIVNKSDKKNNSNK